MDLRPYICERCGGTVNPATLKCEYCGTPYKDESLKHITITQQVPGQHTIRAEVRVEREFMQYDPERARDFTLSKLREQIADGLLGFMKITTSNDYGWEDHTEIIRGEVKVIDPTFGRY
jgi:hypothetical protein